MSERTRPARYVHPRTTTSPAKFSFLVAARGTVEHKARPSKLASVDGRLKRSEGEKRISNREEHGIR